jgi:hypothetical protein
MSINNPNLFLSIGKPVKDEYGRSLGRVVSYALTPSGKFEAAFIELSDGKFVKQPIDQITFNGNEVTFNSKIRTQASVFCDQIPFIWRKDQALKDLAEKRKIAPDLYNELHTNFDTVLKQLRNDAQTLIEDISKEITRCNEELKSLTYAVLHLELEHEVGKIAEDVYRSAFALLQESMKRVTTEKTDLEITKTRLSNILLGDTIEVITKPKQVFVNPSTNTTSIPEKQELPEPPVVVYVKEIGKAGI